MKLYYSVGNDNYCRPLLEYGRKNILVSFAYRILLERFRHIFEVNKISLFYDSGAFTVWNKGGTVDIEGYKRDLREFDALITVAANVDVIPGTQGQKATPEQAALAAEQGWANFDMFRKEGFSKIIHIFHQGDDFKWLHRLIDESEYFGVSPSNDCSTKEKEAWLDIVFRTIDSRGKGSKTHAFGVTSPYLCYRYPWYSVDSSSFAIQAALGSCNVPGVGVVVFSEQGADKPNYFKNLPQAQRDTVEQICAKYGFTPRSLNHYLNRTRMNIINFIEMENAINEKGHNAYYGGQQTMFDITREDWNNNYSRDASVSELSIPEGQRDKSLHGERSESVEGDSTLDGEDGLEGQTLL